MHFYWFFRKINVGFITYLLILVKYGSIKDTLPIVCNGFNREFHSLLMGLVSPVSGHRSASKSVLRHLQALYQCCAWALSIFLSAKQLYVSVMWWLCLGHVLVTGWPCVIGQTISHVMMGHVTGMWLTTAGILEMSSTRDGCPASSMSDASAPSSSSSLAVSLRSVQLTNNISFSN